MTGESEGGGEPAEGHGAGGDRRRRRWGLFGSHEVVDHGDGEDIQDPSVERSPLRSLWDALTARNMPAQRDGSSDSRRKRAATLTLVAGLIVLGLAVWWWSGRDDRRLNELADETCSELEGAIVLQAGPILSGALGEADDLGFTGPELGDEMRSECPGLMEAVDNIGEESERREGLSGQMEAELGECTSDSVTGTVVNRSDVAVDVWIEVDLEDEAGVNVGSSSATVRRLRPGQEGRWEAPVFESYATCRARVGTVSES